MTIAVDLGRKATKPTNQSFMAIIRHVMGFSWQLVFIMAINTANSWAFNHYKTENNGLLNLNGHHFIPRVKINGILMIILALELN